MSVLGTHLYLHQLVMREAAFGFSEFFFEDFQHAYLFHDGWFVSAPAHSALSVQQFLTKNSMIPMLPPIQPNLALSDFFGLFPQMKKKSLKGKRFASVEEVEQKMAEALKGIKIDKFKNCFEQWKKYMYCIK